MDVTREARRYDAGGAAGSIRERGREKTIGGIRFACLELHAGDGFARFLESQQDPQLRIAAGSARPIAIEAAPIDLRTHGVAAVLRAMGRNATSERLCELDLLWMKTLAVTAARRVVAAGSSAIGKRET